MNPSPSLLGRLWRKLFSASPVPVPVRLSASERGLRRNRLAERTIEPLEGRIAPATLLPGGKVLSYTDLDGDEVTITFSKQLFLPTASFPTDSLLQSVFVFSAGKAHTGAENATDDVAQQLQRIDLTKLQLSSNFTPAKGVSFTITAHQQDANGDSVMEGDGHVNIGYINATGVALGSVVVKGDLGQIDAGNSSTAMGLAALKVDSLGKLTTTQAGTASYESAIIGGLGSFTAKSIDGGYLHVTSGFVNAGTPVAVGKIGTVTITNYIKSRSATVVGTNDGRIETTAGIGSLLLGSGLRDAAHPETSDGINGGSGVNSGSIVAGGNIGSIVIHGDLRGGTGASSALITAKSIGSLLVDGALIGSGASSAVVHTSTSIGSVSVGRPDGSGLLGGAGAGSAVISSDGTLGAVRISNIVGVNGTNSAGVSAEGAIASLNILGSMQGGSVLHSGFVESYTSIGNIKIGANLLGGAGERSGTIVSSGSMGDVFVRSQLIGGAGASSGGISSGISGVGSMGAVTISNSLVGAAGANSGLVSSGGSIKSLTITRSGQLGVEQDAVVGGSGPGSGSVYAFGTLGPITVTGSVRGGAGDYSGTIQAHGLLAKVSISADVLGGGGMGSGSVEALDRTLATGLQVAGTMGQVNIGGSIVGGSGIDSGNIIADGNITSLKTKGLYAGGAANSGRVLAGAGSVASGNIGTLALGKLGAAPVNVNTSGSFGGTVLAMGSVNTLTADELYNGNVHVAQSIGSLIVARGMSESTITAGGQAAPTNSTDLAFGSVTIGGTVSASSLLAGYSVTGAAQNGHAQIGSVLVKGSWFSSNLVAGVRDSAGDGFGSADDSIIPATDDATTISRIASVVINGNVGGTGEGTQFGFVAREIALFKVAGEQLGLTKAAVGQVFDLTPGSSSHVTVREVVPAMA